VIWFKRNTRKKKKKKKTKKKTKKKDEKKVKVKGMKFLFISHQGWQSTTRRTNDGSGSSSNRSFNESTHSMTFFTFAPGKRRKIVDKERCMYICITEEKK
jgi:hypothetical protein